MTSGDEAQGLVSAHKASDQTDSERLGGMGWGPSMVGIWGHFCVVHMMYFSWANS